MTRVCAAFLLAATTFLGGSAIAAEPPKKAADLPYCDDDKPKVAQPATGATTQVARPTAVVVQPVASDDDDTQVVDNRPLDERLRALEQSNKDLQQKLQDMQREQKDQSSRIDSFGPLWGRVAGYIDVGAYYVTGTGGGLRPDTGNARFPQYSYIPDTWVFLGDPLSTMINSRGDPASTGESRAVTVNEINNQGKFSFIMNNVNLTLYSGIGKDLSVSASVDFVPRVRNPSKPGVFMQDFLDVRWAYAEYVVPVDAFQLSLFAGKFDPVLGIEYRSQQASDRLGVTPSLICRYTCGRQTGFKARARFFAEKLVIALAVTNGSSVQEYFPFSNSEVDYNNFKTVSGRISTKIPVGAGWEIGVSGAIGAQDLQANDRNIHWHVGADMRFVYRYFQFTAEYVRGKANGQTEPNQSVQCNLAPCLTYQGAYGLIGYQVLNWLTPYVRADWREALHLDGASFAYITRMVRFTGGLQFELGANVVIKGEFTKAIEVGKLPQVNNDVATSSLVVKY